MSPGHVSDNLSLEADLYATRPSLRTNALARLASNAALALTGVVSVTITARWLGPAGKGTLSTMLYIVAVSSLVASLGIGDAAIVIAAGSKKKLQELISASLPPILVACLPAIGILLIASWMANWSQIRASVAVACFLIPLRMFSLTLINFLNATERLIRSSVISIIQGVVEVLAIVSFVVMAGWGITGAVVGAAVGAATSIGLSALALARDGVILMPSWRWSRALPVLKLGASLVSAHVVIALAQRFDLVLVYTLKGAAPAGMYAVALTLAQLAAYASSSLAIAAFPRLARLEVDDGWPLIPRLARMGSTTAMLSGLLLIPASLFLIPVLFGNDFREATVPALVLIAGAVLWSQLAILTRSAAALGHPFVQLTAFGVYVGTMIPIDLLLIPAMGILGAAIASVIAPAVSLLYFVWWYRNKPNAAPIMDFAPRRGDLRELLHFLRYVPGRALAALRQA